MTMASRLTRAGTLRGAGLADMMIALKQATTSISIATPFLSRSVAGHIVRAADEGLASERRMITALNESAVAGGYLSIDAIEEFIAARFDVRSLRNLHAKVLITDGNWGLVGSGNLTEAGTRGGNAELGVVLSKGQAHEAQRDFFERWWQAAEPLDLAYMRSLYRHKQPKAPDRQRRKGCGGIYKAERDVELPDLRRDTHDSGYWLKTQYFSEDRARATHWRGRTWVSDGHTERPDGGDPLYRPTYKEGEHLVIYLIRGPRRGCPAIVRVAAPPTYDPDLVAKEDSQESADRWGWVTWVDVLRATDLSDAPQLSDLGIAPRSVGQHGHIHMSRAQYRRARSAIPRVVQ
jgi:PLD-like domain